MGDKIYPKFLYRRIFSAEASIDASVQLLLVLHHHWFNLSKITFLLCALVQSESDCKSTAFFWTTKIFLHFFWFFCIFLIVENVFSRKRVQKYCYFLNWQNILCLFCIFFANSFFLSSQGCKIPFRARVHAYTLYNKVTKKVQASILHFVERLSISDLCV